ncbi:MAG TPA: DUF1800 domain-containing protein [Acetobacteraceae bacterium]|nr:DUF1800 domain-containing protein [Acetobacteraceae bacterium]
MDTASVQAFTRFGLGRRGDEPAPADPRAWVLDQIAGYAPTPAFPSPAPAPTTAEALAALRADRRDKPKPADSRTRALFLRDSHDFLTYALTTDLPVRERLTWFWANHFTVSLRQGPVAGLVGPFIAEAIRPHVTGRFQDMLDAVMRHPAMLVYLNNAFSIGPDSPAGRRTGRGLNENLARESLELHTVGLAAGFTQADVTSYAAILTGWSIDLRADPPGFKFRPFAHEPGWQTLLGRRFPPGEAGGIAALAFLANHPATHAHLARQLVRHFVADEPQAADVARVAGVLAASGGDLGAATAAVVALPGAWQAGTKLRAPLDLLVGSLRALDVTTAPKPSLYALRLLGQPLWAAPQPNGWGDRAADWAAPEAMLRRVDFAYALAGRLPRPAEAVADAALGPRLRPATRTALARAGSRRDALALLLSSPEFQRR